MEAKYTSEDFVTTENLEQVRALPKGFIHTKNVAGQVHMTREVIDNSVDEMSMKDGMGNIRIVFFRDNKRGQYQISIQDDGRGIPADVLLSASTVIGTSGKRKSSSAYTATGGQFGVGLKTPAALSKRFRIISSNVHEAVTGSVYLKDGKVADHHNEDIKAPNGVLVVFEPDFNFFMDDLGERCFGKEFMATGYLDLINLCRQLNIFNENIHFEFSVVEFSIDEEFWTADTATALRIVDGIYNSDYRVIEYDSNRVIDKSDYLLELWKLDPSKNNVTFRDSWLRKQNGDRLGFEVRMFMLRKPNISSCKLFVSINNVSIMQLWDNSVVPTFLDKLREKICSKLSVLEDMQQYVDFVKSTYNFPVMMFAFDIRYNKAELSGLTKTTFEDDLFASIFSAELDEYITNLGDAYWDNFIELIKNDIINTYARIYDAPVKVKEAKRTFAELNFPKNYYECKSTDNTKTELYIVEGTSAGNIVECRDNETQAVYTTRGKPFNAATRIDQLPENQRNLVLDKIQQDLTKITGINPKMTDLSNCRFSKIIICTDADPDGLHIVALWLIRWYINNPALLESGIIHVAKPPLYSMKASTNKNLFIRDKKALMDARTEFIYSNSLQIRIKLFDGKIVELTKETYGFVCSLVKVVGELLASEAKRMRMPIQILDALVRVVDCIYPEVDYKKLEERLNEMKANNLKISVNELGRFVIISNREDDFIVSLQSIGKNIVDKILPFYNEYKLKDFIFEIRTGFKGSMYEEWTPKAISTLFLILSELDKLCPISRYKGLGEMEPKDCLETLMDPTTRSLIQINTVGDVDECYDLMGNDSTSRKKLLAETGVLSNDFNNLLK